MTRRPGKMLRTLCFACNGVAKKSLNNSVLRCQDLGATIYQVVFLIMFFCVVRIPLCQINILSQLNDSGRKVIKQAGILAFTVSYSNGKGREV